MGQRSKRASRTRVAEPKMSYSRAAWAISTLVIAGCASPAARELLARETNYRAALATLPQKSTRSDLCRLLPPIAVAKPHNIDLAIPLSHWPDRPGYITDVSLQASGILGHPPARNFGWEEHPLDSDFYLSVAYEYRKHRQVAPLPRRRTDGLHLNLNAIDALLYGIAEKPSRSFRVYPSEHDRIVLAPPTLLRSTARMIPSYAVYSPVPSAAKASPTTK